ncbi:MAG: hypothetical protein J7K72_00495 [Candidatus Aenigmarchaeota archaeon]|nr:hypothetical protein [Candidatus Aenigmarchaeota archaeon]
MKEVMNEVKKQSLSLMTSAMGFVAALVWKDAISAWLSPLYKNAEGALGLTVAAFVVTIVVVVTTIIISKIFAPEGKTA